MGEAAARLAMYFIIEAKMEERNASANMRFGLVSAAKKLARKLARGLVAGVKKGMVQERIARTSPLLGGRAPRVVVDDIVVVLNRVV